VAHWAAHFVVLIDGEMSDPGGICAKIQYFSAILAAMPTLRHYKIDGRSQLRYSFTQISFGKDHNIASLNAGDMNNHPV
jgi:hypothetical protein